MQKLEGSLVVLEAQQASMDDAAQSHHAEVLPSHTSLSWEGSRVWNEAAQSHHAEVLPLHKSGIWEAAEEGQGYKGQAIAAGLTSLLPRPGAFVSDLETICCRPHRFTTGLTPL